MRRFLMLFGTLMLWPALALADCGTKNAEQVVQILGYGINLNERFKRTVNAGEESGYRLLREKNEKYSEEVAIPCVRRAVDILDLAVDEPLLRRLMEYAISRQNSADETTSEAMASVFARYPDAVSNGISAFSPSGTRSLLRCIEAGWPGVRKTLESVAREEREGQLKAMRAELVKRVATKQRKRGQV